MSPADAGAPGRRRTSTRTRTAKARTSTCSWRGPPARERRSTSRPAAGTSPGGCARRASRSSPATPRPACGPTSICRAESLPFADGAFDVVACRTAAHHFADPAAAVREMARVAPRARADRRHGLHGRRRRGGGDAAATRRTCATTREAEWRALVEDAGPRRRTTCASSTHTFDFAAWLARTGCEGDEARACRGAPRRPRRRRPADARQDRDPGGQGALMAIFVDNDTRLVVQGLTGSEGRFHGLRNRALRDEPRRGRHAGQGRPGRRGRSRPRHRRRGRPRARREHVDDLRAGAVRRRRHLRGGRRGRPHGDHHHRGRPGARDAPDPRLHPLEGRPDARAELPRRALARARRTSGSSRPRSSRRATSASSRARGRSRTRSATS